MERRANSRSSVVVKVFIPVAGKKHHVCKTINLSSRGVYLVADPGFFSPDTPMVLIFAISKLKSSVVQLHRMTAKVVRFGSRGVALAFCPQAKTPINPRKAPATVSVMKRRSSRSSFPRT